MKTTAQRSWASICVTLKRIPSVPARCWQAFWRVETERFSSVEAFVERFLAALEGRSAVEPEDARLVADLGDVGGDLGAGELGAV